MVPEITKSGSMEFFREVAKYFMDFLETDFHKHKFPRRVVKNRNSDNLLIGLNLKKYDTFYGQVIKALTSGFGVGSNIQIKKGQFKTKLPKTLYDLISLQISKITNQQINGVLQGLAESIEVEAKLHSDEYDVALSSALESAGKAISKALIHPFVGNIEKPIQNANLGDSDDIYLIEQELTEIFVRSIENKVSEIIAREIAGESVRVEKELKEYFALEDTKATLTGFFENLRVADLYQELFELFSNKSILDKQDLYLYLCDVSFRGNKYPIFYIPIEMSRVDESFVLQFDSQIYLNKKALEYITQEFNTEKGTKGNLKSASDRIIYISQYQDQLIVHLNEVLTEIADVLEVKGKLHLGNKEEETTRGASAQISTAFHFALFDKSDEALVNDYEEILQEIGKDGGSLADAFNTLLGDFLQKNPQGFGNIIDSEWDETSTPDRLVASSPIPLNSEQLQILSAVRRDGCKYIIVEGPPGTGKSHTITAVVFDAILHNKSVLVLSDKKEALDVVEKNITEAINKVRFGEDFQNPILRLGKTGNTYGQILAKSSIADLRTHHRVVKGDIDSIEDLINSSSLALREDIEAETLNYESIDLEEVAELLQLENSIESNLALLDPDELAGNKDIAYAIEELRTTLTNVAGIVADPIFDRMCRVLGATPVSVADYLQVLNLITRVSFAVREVEETAGLAFLAPAKFSSFDAEDLPILSRLINGFDNAKAPLVGYMFAKSRVAELERQFHSSFKTSLLSAKDNLPVLRDAFNVMSNLDQMGTKMNREFGTNSDFVAVFHEILSDSGFSDSLRATDQSASQIAALTGYSEKYPKTLKKMGINLDIMNSMLGNKMTDLSSEDFDKLLRYLMLKSKIENEFGRISEIQYKFRKSNLEQLVITKVAHELDGRVINFYENNKNDAEMLKSVIKNKQRFPKEQFAELKNAFPCILAGIRDFAEYIPMQFEMFDLLIIDEASQVSLAQAFPALIRAKKVLILGDKKQFSNIKANQARSDTNREYLSVLENSFKKNVGIDPAQLVRLKKFNIKTSVLDFFEFISNYQMQLTKHFRGYKEIISYSNKYFYRNLQVMKIRGKSIDEVIKFSYVKPTQDDMLYKNANLAEVEFIIDQLLELKRANHTQSVGIITPHTDQQKLLVEKISRMPERDYFEQNFKLKIMTFDTCQGEERDIIFYSMVASNFSDKLWGIFIKDLANVDIEEDGQIKATECRF